LGFFLFLLFSEQNTLKDSIKLVVAFSERKNFIKHLAVLLIPRDF